MTFAYQGLIRPTTIEVVDLRRLRGLIVLLLGMLVMGSAIVLTPAMAQACTGGAYQIQVERYLAHDRQYGAVSVDGCQSATDKATITRFQNAMDLRPGSAAGVAGPRTYAVVRRLSATHWNKCYSSSTIVCVDLTAQTMWVARGGTRLLGPTVIRSGVYHPNAPAGKRGGPTPTGLFHIYNRKNPATSSIFHVSMDWWQGFAECGGGSCADGLHEATNWIYNPETVGSHGCANLTPAAARSLWSLTRIGTLVYVFGRKPGT